MTQAQVETSRSVTIERIFAHPPEKLWRALTTPHLLAEWLMESDFAANPGHAFTFRAAWGSVAGRVLTADKPHTLAYTWAAMGIETVVTFTLTATDGGTMLRLEQSGFRPGEDQAFHGAQYGWQQFLGRLDQVLPAVT